mmetsp:Transcript_28955/g.48865  ORF Transcript_28955/g.48865 Transcript_28955/m.48865 type:complete len:195 (-) Transcript_28955:431-1015(-)
MPPKVKVGPGARDNVNDLFRTDRAEIFMDNDPHKGYEDDLENRIVYRRIESHIEELRVDEAWTKKRFRLLFWISLSFIGGGFLFVLSNMRIRLTVFESQPELWYLEIIGYVMMTPSLYGLKYLLCPTQAQRELRSEIMAKRRVRHKLYPEDFKEIEVFNDLEDKYAQREAQEKAEKAKKAQKSKDKGREGSYKV